MFILRISGWIYIDSDCNINSPTSRFIQTTDCRDIIYIYIYTSHVSCITYSYTLVAGGAFVLSDILMPKRSPSVPWFLRSGPYLLDANMWVLDHRIDLYRGSPRQRSTGPHGWIISKSATNQLANTLATFWNPTISQTTLKRQWISK